jgi:hypothetical protein
VSDELQVQRAIVVAGEATVRRAPDLAVVAGSVSVRDARLEDARDRANTRASAILAMLRELGIPDADVVAPSLQTHPTYDHARGRTKLTGYEANRPFSVRVRDLALLAPLLDRLVDDGPTQLHGTSMELDDAEAAYREALGAAVAQARGRAELLAGAAGVTLGAALRVEEESGGAPGPFAMRGMMQAEMAADAAPTEVAAGEVEISARVRAWFALV